MGCSNSKHAHIPNQVDVRRKIKTLDVAEKPAEATNALASSVLPPKQKLSPLRTAIVIEEVARPQSVEKSKIVDAISIHGASGDVGQLGVIEEDASSQAARSQDIVDVKDFSLDVIVEEACSQTIAIDAINKDPSEPGDMVQVSTKVPVLSESEVIDILNLDSKVVLRAVATFDSDDADDSSVSTEFTFEDVDAVPSKKMTTTHLKERALCVLAAFCTIMLYIACTALFGWIGYNVIHSTRDAILLHLEVDPFGASKIKESLIEVRKIERDNATARNSIAIKLAPVVLGEATKRLGISNATRKAPLLVPRNTKVIYNFTSAEATRSDEHSSVSIKASAISSSVSRDQEKVKLNKRDRSCGTIRRQINLKSIKQELYEFIDADNYFI
jgi:hypothetical protein